MKFIDAIFCDDIRYEVNNKLSLIGVYNDQMILRVSDSEKIEWPISMNLSLLLRFKLEENEKNPDHFEFEYILNNNSVVKVNGEFNGSSTQAQFTLTITACIPLEPGDLGFSLKLYAKEKLLLSEQQEKSIKVLKS